MYRLSLVLAALFVSIAALSTACIVSGPATDDDDDDSPVGISCATADEAWSTCAAVTGSPTPAPFCASLAAGSIGADSDWGCIAALLGQWDCATGLPSSLDEFGTCINLDPGGDDDDSVPTGPCNDDTYEPNNDLTTAAPVTPGNYTGLVSCLDDDDYYSISVGAGECLQANFTFVDDEGDIDVSIRDAEDAYLDGGGSSSDNESVAYVADTAATYYLYVKLFSDGGTAVGNTYDMLINSATPPAETCTDGIDNDCDGDIDCADSDCTGNASCVEDCTDGIDNDADGDTDCADSSCDGHASCVEDCGDGVDNDADGDTDCADSSCAGDSACICATDQFEENDTYNAPKPIPAGTYGVYDSTLLDEQNPGASCTSCLNTCLGDEDWYSFSSTGAATITLAFSDPWGDLDCKLYDADEAGWTSDGTPNWEPNLTMSTQPGYIPTLARSTGVGDSEDCSTAATLAANGNYLLNVYFYTSQQTDLAGFGNNYALDISY